MRIVRARYVTERRSPRGTVLLGVLLLAGCFDLGFQVGDDASTSSAAAGPITGSTGSTSVAVGSSGPETVAVVSTGEGAGAPGAGGAGANGPGGADGSGASGAGGNGSGGAIGRGGAGGESSGDATSSGTGGDGGARGPASVASSSTGNPGLPDGEPCVLSQECQNGKCVDDVCCDDICIGECQACSALKKGGGADGVCGPIVLGDPDVECAEICGECVDGECVESCLGSFACCSLVDPPECRDPLTCV
jgi:hypothetical protein